MINYDEIARQAPLQRASFETLIRRAERGEPLPPVPDEKWLSVTQAIDILCCSGGTLGDAIRDSSIRQKSRSVKYKNARRGCGILINAQDIRKLREIKQRCRLGMAGAVRVFDMLREDNLV